MRTVSNVATGSSGSNREIAPTIQPLAPTWRWESHSIPSRHVTSVNGGRTIPSGNMPGVRMARAVPAVSAANVTSLTVGGTPGNPASLTQARPSPNVMPLG